MSRRRIKVGREKIPPSAPSNLLGSALSSSQIELTWGASTDSGGSGLAGYRLYRGGVLASVLGPGLTSYVDTNLVIGTTYSYYLVAYDADGNVSGQSNVAQATTLGDTTAPSVPTGLAATAVSSSQINLTWVAATDNVGVTGYRLQRATDAAFSANLNTSDLGNVTSNSVTGLNASTQYYFRIAARDAAGNFSAYSSSANATTLAQAGGSLAYHTVFGAAGDLTLTQTANYDYISGTDSLTGALWTGTQIGAAASPRAWNDPWASRPPSLHKIGGNDGQAVSTWWQTALVSGVNGPGGTNNETVLRVRRLKDHSGVPQCGIEITNTAPNGLASDYGMIYVRIKRRVRDLLNMGIQSYQTLMEYKGGSAAEDDDRRIYLSVGYTNGVGWSLSMQSSNSSSRYPGGTCWEGKSAQALPRPWDNWWANKTIGAGQGEKIWYKGCFVDYTGAGEAPEPDWGAWTTVVFAFRIHSIGPRSWVAGNAAQGWTYIGMCVGTRTAAAPNSQIKTRFYMPGANLYDQRIANGTSAGMLFVNNCYGPGYVTGYDYETGSVEIYDHWPADHPVAEKPAGAI